MRYEILFSEGAVMDLKNVPSKDQIKIIGERVWTLVQCKN